MAKKKRSSVAFKLDDLEKHSLEDLIRNKGIEFFSYGRKLDTDLENFGQYNWDLTKHILRGSGNKMRIQGPRLQNYLTNEENLYALSVFLSQLWFEGVKKYSDIAFHVNVDIEKLDQHYQKPSKEKLFNGLGEFVCDAASWVPEMPYFEKLWNFAVDYAVGGMVGYPGYEHPRNDDAFRERISVLAQHYMIGTPKQIKRYEKYALNYLKNVTAAAEGLRRDQNKIFEEPYSLIAIENDLRSARVLAENIEAFSIDYESN